MKNKPFVRLTALVLCTGSLLAGCKKPAEPAEPAHVHTFTDWTLQATASCKYEGREDRYCTECGEKEERPIPKTPHDLGAYNICRTCSAVEFDEDAALVELGNVVAPWYDAGAVANCPWDLVVWDGILYRAAGDYDKNSGITPIWGYNIADKTWKLTGEAKDEALHRFIDICGILTSPGIDPRQDWRLGNFHILQDGAWRQVRNLPNGVHNFDMVGFDDKIFAGLGVEEGNSPCVMSTNGGQTFDFVPLYKDGQKVDTKGKTYIRIYEYMVYQNQLYALVSLDSDYSFYRFEVDKLVYVGDARRYIVSDRSSFNYLNSKVEWGDTLYMVNNVLWAMKDFADPSANKVVKMPNGEKVADALLLGDVLYTLAYAQKADGTYETVIYKSATGAEGSFTEVLRFDYAVPPCSFTQDSGYFYIGMGSKKMIHTANGMVMRAKMP